MAYTVAPGLSLDTKVYRYMELAKFLSLIHQHHRTHAADPDHLEVLTHRASASMMDD